MQQLGTELSGWEWWVLAGALLAIAELLGTGLVLLAFGLSCLGGVIVAALTDWGFAAQLAVTGGLAAAMTPVMVRLYHRRRARRGPGPLDPGWERGQCATVVRYGGRVGVRLRGDFFPARMEDGASPEEGTKVEVQYLEGITAVVRTAGPTD